MPVLEREEYIEQAYFFQSFRERLVHGLPSQEILERVGEELLTTTKLPLAVSFLASEMKHSGLMAPAMVHIGHYFTAVPGPRGRPGGRWRTQPVLHGEQARLHPGTRQGPSSRPETSSLAGLFVFQFESLSRNRLGKSTPGASRRWRRTPHYNEDWRDYDPPLQTRLGDVDFADLIFVRSLPTSSLERRRRDPGLHAQVPHPLRRPRKGKIARCNRGRDPMYLFSALQTASSAIPRSPVLLARRAGGGGASFSTEDCRSREPHQARGERDQPGHRPLPGRRQGRGDRRVPRGLGQEGRRGIVVSSQYVSGCT